MHNILKHFLWAFDYCLFWTKSNDPVKYCIISECTNMVFNYNMPWIEAGNNVRSRKKLQAIFACMKIQSTQYAGAVFNLDQKF